MQKEPNEYSTMRSSGSEHKWVSAPYFNPYFKPVQGIYYEMLLLSAGQ